MLNADSHFFIFITPKISTDVARRVPTNHYDLIFLYE
jgi:hypothetical protein